MLDIVVPGIEFWDEKKEEFIAEKTQFLQLEHSLVSLAKWESKWCKPFLDKDDKTTEQVIDYIRCMTITQNVKPEVYDRLTSKIFDTIKAYIDAPMTATWFKKEQSKKNNEVITAEIVYYWMIVQNIPMECQKWHLNRLLTLIRVCGIKNSPPKKRGKKAMFAERRALNEQRRAQLNTKG